MSDTLVEPVFGVDDFRKPKILTEYEATIQAIMIVLFGKPGCYPSIPDLGMNIQQYRGLQYNDIDTDAIKVQLAYQCKAIQSEIIDGSIEVKKTEVNGDLALVFIIPIDTGNAENTVLLGVKLRDEGISYNYDLINATSAY